MSTSRVGDRISALCNEIGASPDFAQLVGQHLLKLDLHLKVDVSGQHEQGKQKKTSLATQMANVILTCTRNCDLSIIAVDDVQFADEMSFEVIQALFEMGRNLMIVCACRQHSMDELAVDSCFWERLNNEYLMTGRYVQISMQPLNKKEMREVIAKTLGFGNEDVSEQLLKSVLAQTKGTPQLAKILLEHLKRNYSPTTTGCVINDMQQFGAMAEVRVSWKFLNLL